MGSSIMKDLEMIKALAAKCIGCGECTRACSFLAKYDLNHGDYERSMEMAFHCFLCGKCDGVCPVGIKGSEYYRSIRRLLVSSGDSRYVESDYKATINEKSDYKFKNYRGATEGVVLFPGCNFPSLFPKTSKALSKLFKDEYGIGTVYDCCGKPIAELGLTDDEDRIIAGINQNLVDNNIGEIVTLCPNCHYFFAGKMECKVTSIYDKLAELGVSLDKPQGLKMYLSCPDRYDRQWVASISSLLGYEPEVIDDIQCCGLGGHASRREKAIADGFTDEILAKYGGAVVTFCASCAGKLYRGGAKDVRHILSLMMGVEEPPATGSSYINRMMTKLK